MTKIRSDSGFSLMEIIVATAVLMAVSAIVTGAMLQLTKTQATVWNRTEMHSGIRGATELLQQEVGQAGRLGLPAAMSINTAVGGQTDCNPSLPATYHAVTVGVTTKDASGATITTVKAIDPATGGIGDIDPLTFLFANAGPPAAYELLTVMDGHNDHSMETVKIGAVDLGARTITACFLSDHPAGTVILPLGGFITGVIPDSGILNPSTKWVLKMYGDINGDGTMVYVEYTCGDPFFGPSTDTTHPSTLLRNVVSFNGTAASKTTPGPQILLSNLVNNPPDPPGTPLPCFSYQTTTLTVQGTAFTFVLDVAITLTVQTQNLDPVTRTYQKETKALLNVSPRNVFTAWEYANIGYTDRIQSTPVSITALLP